MSANDRLNVGIAGLGRMGSRHARNLATRVPNAHLVAADRRAVHGALADCQPERNRDPGLDPRPARRRSLTQGISPAALAHVCITSVG